MKLGGKVPRLVKRRLEYLRGELRAERISYGELNELMGLVHYIEPDDVELLEAAGAPEFPQEGGDALEMAQHCAEVNRVKVAVMDDPIANADEAAGPFGYCPLEAVDLLFPCGRLVCVCSIPMARRCMSLR